MAREPTSQGQEALIARIAELEHEIDTLPNPRSTKASTGADRDQ